MVTVTYGTLPKPTKSGHIFLGWYDAVSGGNKIISDTVVNSDITVYAHWYQLPSGTTVTNQSDGYNYFSTPITIYYNPTTNSVCNEYTSEQSVAGVKTGCMKWYAYSEKDGILNMILDHNINSSGSGVQFINYSTYSNGSTIAPQLGVTVTKCDGAWTSGYAQNCRGPLVALRYIQNNTPGWITTVQGDYATYTVSTSNSGYIINYSVDYNNDGVKDYNARLITREEASYLGCTSNNSSCNSFLYDNMSSTTGLSVYWTSSPYSNEKTRVWYVTYNGGLGITYPDSSAGIRPVITVPVEDVLS